MNDRIKALQLVLQMATSYTNDWALNPLLDEAVEKGVPSSKQAEYAKGKQCLAIDLVHELLEEAETADAMPEEKAKLALAVAEPFHIEGMMVISTGHVSETTMKALETSHLPIITKEWSAEGAVIYVPSDQEAWNEVASDNSNSDVPDDIFACMCHARAHGCCWLLLDADGPKVEGLATFDW